MRDHPGENFTPGQSANRDFTAMKSRGSSPRSRVQSSSSSSLFDDINDGDGRSRARREAILSSLGADVNGRFLRASTSLRVLHACKRAAN